MKLYDATTAPNPRRVRIFLAEKSVEIPTVQVDIAGMENRQPEFLAKNPLAGVPILELDDGSVVAESVAICRYIEALHPAPALFGDTPAAQGRVEMWNRRMEMNLMMPISGVFRHGHPFFKGRIEQVPEFADACRRESQTRLSWLNETLGDGEFIAGDSYSIADITALCAIDFAKVSKIRLADEHLNLKRWYERVSTRPSAAA
jgi:glutathione S-transferase